jgi:ATP-binding cassette, subfamily B, bacterial
LTRIYDPVEGTILINGIDLKTVSLNEWIHSLSVLGQKYWMHEFLVKDSIAMGRPETVPFPLDSIKDMSTEVDPIVERAAQLSGASRFIGKWESRFNQQLGREHDKGVEPSQGQEQKLAIARQLYRLMNGGQMLVLDEPTAAIDPQAEAEIFASLNEVAKDKNLILISHRFNTVKMADKIFVIENAKLEETGTHNELIQKNGVYAKMFNAQAKGFLESAATENIAKSEQESVL